MPLPSTSIQAARVSPPAALARLAAVGPAHPVVRRCSRARRNLLPRSERVVLIAGRRAHEAVLRAGAVVDCLLWCPGERPDPWLVDVAQSVAEVAGEAHLISPRTLTRVYPAASAPELVSLVRLPEWRPVEVITPAARLVLVADGIEYAGNLGTLVRTADACAADAVILTCGVARITHPKAFKASRGTVLTTPTVSYRSVASAKRDLVAAGFALYVADPAAVTSYRDASLGQGSTAVVVGSEGEGVCQAWRTPDGTAVSIPMHGRADSLNVAVSAALPMFEARARLG
ncbi:MAG: TrmH family RNA methyltransferase [Nocardioidaceae bacterium]